MIALPVTGRTPGHRLLAMTDHDGIKGAVEAAERETGGRMRGPPERWLNATKSLWSG